MTQDERIEKRFRDLRRWLVELQAEDKHAELDDEHDSHNIARVDLHEIKLAFFAMAQERDRLRRERDERTARIDELVKNIDEYRETLTELRRWMSEQGA